MGLGAQVKELALAKSTESPSTVTGEAVGVQMEVSWWGGYEKQLLI